jgi:hypothetical protein
MLTFICLLLIHIVHLLDKYDNVLKMDSTYIKIIICLIKKLRETKKKEITSVH